MNLPFYWLNAEGFFCRGRKEGLPTPPVGGAATSRIGATHDPEGLDTIEWNSPGDMVAICRRWAVLNNHPRSDGEDLAAYYLDPEPAGAHYRRANAPAGQNRRRSSAAEVFGVAA